MAAATVVSNRKPHARHIQTAQDGFYYFGGQFAFPTGTAATTCTVTLDVPLTNFIEAQATFAAAPAAGDGQLYVTQSGQTLTIGRLAATTDSIAFYLAAKYQ